MEEKYIVEVKDSSNSVTEFVNITLSEIVRFKKEWRDGKIAYIQSNVPYSSQHYYNSIHIISVKITKMIPETS